MSTQLEPGTLLVASTTRQFDGLLLQATAVNRASLHCICAPSHSISLLMTSRRSGAQFVDGYELATGRCILLEAGAETELIAQSRGSYILISLSGTLLAGIGPVPGLGSVSLRTGVRLVEHGVNAGLALEAAVANALANNAGPSIAHAMLALAMRVLRGPGNVAVTAAAQATHDDGARRRLAVERARKYIREHLTDPMRLADLCAHAHLQSRSLEYGFRELVRLSPMGYVRMLRLGEVRAQLLDGFAQRSISEIALDAGFSHLSQFVVDYKKVFGETPSSTRRTVLNSLARQRTQDMLRRAY